MILYTHRRADWQIQLVGNEFPFPGVKAVRIDWFRGPVRLSGLVLPSWKSSGDQDQFARTVRISVAVPGSGGWKCLAEETDLPAAASTRIALAAHVQVVKVEILSVHCAPANERDINEDSRTVAFAGTQGLSWEWEQAGDNLTLPWQPELPRSPAGALAEVGPGLTRSQRGDELVWSNGWLTCGLSLSRPALTRFSFDTEQTGRDRCNFLQPLRQFNHIPGCGPWFASLETLASCDLVGGEVMVGPTGVRYAGLQLPHGATGDVAFTFHQEGLTINLELRVPASFTAVAAELWRWIWNLREVIPNLCGAAVMPESTGPMGWCRLPMLWHFPNFGGLALTLEEGDAATTFVVVETNRAACESWAGLVVGARPLASGEVEVLAGTHRARVRLARAVTVPERLASEHRAFRRHWASVFCFRPEYFGMANNAASVNCHFVQHIYADMADAQAGHGPDLVRMRELCRHTLDLAFGGGSGYGHLREHYLDSDICLIIAAAVIAAGDADLGWARRIWPALSLAAERTLQARNSSGLIVSSRLSGNSGAHHWSSNWWDVISFGHIDGFVNGYAFRALRLLSGLAQRLGDSVRSDRYGDAAARLRTAYLPALLNPTTGWLAGWRSRDGLLHDHAFLFVNGMAVAFGLVEGEMAREIMQRLETLREKSGPWTFHYGLPGNLRPIPESDYAKLPGRIIWGEPLRPDGRDTFGNYENGALTLCQSYYYLRALAITGMLARTKIEEDVLQGLDEGLSVGGLHSGLDWSRRDGRACGYEGMLADQFYCLLAIAQNRGLLPPLRMSIK